MFNYKNIILFIFQISIFFSSDLYAITDASHAVNFIQQNTPQTRKEIHDIEATTSNVCSYVAKAYNHELSNLIEASLDHPVDIFNDGKPVLLQTEGNRYWTGLVLKDSNDEVFYSRAGIAVVPYHGHYYLLTSWGGIGYFNFVEPVNVLELKGHHPARALCDFPWRWTAYLVKNNSPKICAKALAGKTFKVIPWNDSDIDQKQPYVLPKVAQSPFPTLNGSPAILGLSKPAKDLSDEKTNVEYESYGKSAYLDLTNTGQQTLLAELSYDADMHQECSDTLLTLLDGKKISSSTLNQQLLTAQEPFKMDCNASVYPIYINGKVYIEADHADEFSKNNEGDINPKLNRTSRTLLSIVADQSGEHIETMCQIEHRLVFRARLRTKK